MREILVRLDGFEFGTRESGILVTGITGPGLVRYRSQRGLPPAGRRVAFGRDYTDPQPWTLSVAPFRSDPVDASDRMGWMAAWWGDAHRRYEKPGAESVLSWTANGRTRRTYGRCEEFDWGAGLVASISHSEGMATFQPSTPFVYAEDPVSTRLTITPPLSGGLVFPVEFPWGTLTGGTLQGVLSNLDGTAPTDDVQITVHGPIVSPKVTGPGWRLEFPGLSLAYDRYITVNARTGAVLWDNGGSAAGRLSRQSRVTDVRIPRGDSRITFTGIDNTGTGYVNVQFRPAFTSI